MNNLDSLIKHFEEFPGVGARQARRFAFHLLTRSPSDIEEIAALISNLQANVAQCTNCFRFFARSGGTQSDCSICIDSNRDRSKLMIVERDSDVVAVERSRVYEGLYFVLGGTIPLLSSKEASGLRGGALKATIDTRIENGLTEIILAFAVNPDGENTSRYVASLLAQQVEQKGLTITELGRGLSTGSELEYADPETIKNAITHRG
ncbi:MAG: recombination protein RecR, recombination protein RecR [Candidatus Parcubacteria bacterium]|jgi:recombination protein RecR